MKSGGSVVGWLALVLVVAVVSAGCSRTVDGTARAVPLDAKSLVGLAGKWVGGYTCAQGYTEATMTLHASDPMTGTFEFRTTETSYDIPAGTLGSSTLDVTAEPGNDVRISPRDWIVKPGDDWELTDFVATNVTDYSTQTLQGYVMSSNCKDFVLHRGGASG